MNTPVLKSYNKKYKSIKTKTSKGVQKCHWPYQECGCTLCVCVTQYQPYPLRADDACTTAKAKAKPMYAGMKTNENQMAKVKPMNADKKN